jgi:hypothetical protein
MLHRIAFMADLIADAVESLRDSRVSGNVEA